MRFRIDLILGAVALLGMSTLALPVSAQSQDPDAAKTAGTTAGGAYEYFGRVGLSCAGGASMASAGAKPTLQCGGLISGPFFDLEAGVMGPQAAKSNASAYVSTNAWAPLIPTRALGNKYGVPLLVGGYTRMFQTGNALDYGIAFAHPIDKSHSLQFEVRDYRVFSSPDQHNLVFRVVWLLGLPD
jgi:hypothetical protein